MASIFPLVIFCSQLSDKFPSGGKWVKHAASLEVEGALFYVDCGTELIGHVLRGALLAPHVVTSGLAVFMSPFPKKQNQRNKQTKPTIGIWIMVCRPLVNQRTSAGLVRHRLVKTSSVQTRLPRVGWPGCPHDPQFYGEFEICNHSRTMLGYFSIY